MNAFIAFEAGKTGGQYVRFRLKLSVGFDWLRALLGI